MKITIKDFRHTIHYLDNKFQYITLTLKTDQWHRQLLGTFAIEHWRNGMKFDTPAAVFAALYEKVLAATSLDLILDETDNGYATIMNLIDDTDTFTFSFRELRNCNEGE